MSSHRDTKKVPASNLKLKKMVDWKIFELQSVLVSDDVDTESVNDSLLWFQPRHFSEVLEERVNDDKCGYPLCSNPLDDKNNASYRINYAEKKIYSIELSKNYCCVSCIEKAQLLEKRFDDSVPYSRSVTKTLDLTAPVQSNIEEVLGVLAPAPKKGESKSIGSETELSPPPMYTSSVLSERGALEVQFVDGLPVPAAVDAVASDSHAERRTSKEKANPSSSSPPAFRTDPHSGTPMAQESNDDINQVPSHTTESAAGSALHREVYHNRSFASTTATMNALSLKDGTPEQSQSSDASAGAAPSMAEMFATMNALREKHKLANPSTIPTNSNNSSSSSTRFTNGSLLEV